MNTSYYRPSYNKRQYTGWLKISQENYFDIDYNSTTTTVVYRILFSN